MVNWYAIGFKKINKTLAQLLIYSHICSVKERQTNGLADMTKVSREPFKILAVVMTDFHLLLSIVD